MVAMVLILDCSSGHVAHAWRNIRSICDCSRSNQMPYSDQIRQNARYVRSYFWVTILYKYRLRIEGTPGIFYYKNISMYSSLLEKLPWFRYKTVPPHALRTCKVKQVMSGGKGNQDDTSEDLKEANHQFYFTGRIFLPFNHLFHNP